MRHLLLHNWELKLLALLIAVALWLFVVTSDRVEMAVAAPIEYVGLGDRVLLRNHVQSVDVHLEVARWAIDRARPENLRVRVDLASLHEGDTVVRLSPQDVQAPPGVTVRWVVPARLSVGLESTAVRPLVVVPHLRGQPAPGHVVERVTVEPTVVEVKGPRSTIETRATVETAPVDIAGSRRPVTQAVRLLLPDLAVAAGDPSVRVTVHIQPAAVSGREKESSR